MHLANAISYITDGEKTQDGTLVGSHNCNVDTALQEMLSVKRKYGKTDKRQGYHFIIQETGSKAGDSHGDYTEVCGEIFWG